MSLAMSGEQQSGAIDFGDITSFAAPFREAGARHALIATARQLRPPNWRAIVRRYPSIRQPALIVWCDNDRVVPLSSGRRLARAMPDAKLRVVRGCEHSPQDEQPAALLGLLGGFLR